MGGSSDEGSLGLFNTGAHHPPARLKLPLPRPFGEGFPVCPACDDRSACDELRGPPPKGAFTGPPSGPPRFRAVGELSRSRYQRKPLTNDVLGRDCAGDVLWWVTDAGRGYAGAVQMGESAGGPLPVARSRRTSLRAHPSRTPSEKSSHREPRAFGGWRQAYGARPAGLRPWRSEEYNGPGPDGDRTGNKRDRRSRGQALGGARLRH